MPGSHEGSQDKYDYFYNGLMTIENIISELKNQECWRPWRGGRSAIFLELGEKLSEKKGLYTLCIDSCPWQVFKKGSLYFNDNTEYKEIENLLNDFKGASVINVEFDKVNHQESIIFSNDLILQTYHNSSQDDWAILTPEKEIIIRRNQIEVTSAEGK